MQKGQLTYSLIHSSTGVAKTAIRKRVKNLIFPSALQLKSFHLSFCNGREKKVESENDFAIDAFARVFQCNPNVSLTVIMCALVLFLFLPFNSARNRESSLTFYSQSSSSSNFSRSLMLCKLNSWIQFICALLSILVEQESFLRHRTMLKWNTIYCIYQESILIWAE